MEIELNELGNVEGIGKKTLSRVREYFLKKTGYISKYDEGLHLKKNSVNKGDCLELMNGIPDGSVDMILADLPYGTTNAKWDSIIDLDKLWLQYERIIKDNGAIVLTASQPFTNALINSNKNLFKYELIWIKNRGTGMFNAKLMPMKAHENILVFYKDLPKYNPQMREGKPYKCKQGKQSGVYGDSDKEIITINDGERYPLSYLNFNSTNGRNIHPTQKPTELFEYLIKTYTNKGDLVLDNTAGSGTTAVAAINTGRKYICIEKDKEYYEKSVERVNSATKLDKDRTDLEMIKKYSN